MRFDVKTAGRAAGQPRVLPALPFGADRELARAAQTADRLRAGGAVYAAAGQPVSLYHHEGRGPQQPDLAAGDPAGHGVGGLQQPGHAVSGIRSGDPCALHADHYSAGEPHTNAGQPASGAGAHPVPAAQLGHGGDLYGRRAGQLREADGLRRYRSGDQLLALVPVLPAAAARLSVRGSTLAVAADRADAAAAACAGEGRQRAGAGNALLSVLHRDPGRGPTRLSALRRDRRAAPQAQPAVDAGAAVYLADYLYSRQPAADYGDRDPRHALSV